MIIPALKDDALLADILAAQDAAGEFHLWWFGQSGFLLQWQGRHLLIDPYLSDSLTQKYATTDKPHVRMSELVIDPRRLDFIDVVTSSHIHTDHLDGETLALLLESNPEMTVVVPAANQEFAADRLNVEPSRLTTIDDGMAIEAAGFQFHGVPAAHEAVERDETGCCKFLGYVIQFGDSTIYHSGDTILFDGMVERLRKWDIDVAILPINGQAPERRVAGNLWGREAAQLAKDIDAGIVIPCHYDMFEFNTATPDEFVATAREIGQPHQVLRCGERWSSSADG
jgi:L-ascorbate metabolism protein UlaG (beta-lactamase superfamily)